MGLLGGRDDGGRLQLQDGLAQLLFGAGARRLHQFGPLHVQRGWRDVGRRRLHRVVAERLHLHRAGVPVHCDVVLDPQELLLGRVEHGRRDWYYRPHHCHVGRRGRAQVGSGHVPDHLGRYRRATQFQLYSPGVYAPKSYSSTSLDHGVAVVGYAASQPAGVLVCAWTSPHTNFSMREYLFSSCLIY